MIHPIFQHGGAGFSLASARLKADIAAQNGAG
jgi:hypothetical protein